MKIFVVLGHPDPKSFNHAIAAEAVRTIEDAGHTPLFHDLQAEGFDPVLPAAEIPRQCELPPLMEQHCQELEQADGIVVVHPNWWGMPPAVMKGWIDRVIRPGRAYEFLEGDSGEGVPHGLLRAKAALVFNTGNTAAERERKVFGDPLERIWKDCIFGLCGVHTVRRRLFETIVTSTLEQRQAWLGETSRMVREVFGLSGNQVSGS